VLDQPIGAVWAIVGSFGALKAWVAGVDSCALEGSGIGAIRSVRLAGHVTHERLVALDPARHCISYALIEPHILPARNVQATIALRSLGLASTELTWFTEAAEIDGPIDQLQTRIENFYAASIELLAQLLASKPAMDPSPG
jgi:hypothetical protein